MNRYERFAELMDVLAPGQKELVLPNATISSEFDPHSGMDRIKVISQNEAQKALGNIGVSFFYKQEQNEPPEADIDPRDKVAQAIFAANNLE
jgi:hypothetical protein